MNNDKEIWHNIQGYEGLYQISCYGRVKSLKREQTIVSHNQYGEFSFVKKIPERILKLETAKTGYIFVELKKNNKRKHFYIHRLVAESFLPNPYNYPQINHIDEVKSNNKLENLEWCDASYNMNYGAVRNKIAKTKINGKRSKPIMQIYNDEIIKVWPSMREAERHGFRENRISACCNKKASSYKGYIWKFI